jgi:hypothetical protein
MIEAIVIAVIIAIVVGALLTFLLGPLIKSIPAPVAQIVGDFFVKFGWAAGLIAGLWWFFTHSKL